MKGKLGKIKRTHRHAQKCIRTCTWVNNNSTNSPRFDYYVIIITRKITIVIVNVIVLARNTLHFHYFHIFCLTVMVMLIFLTSLNKFYYEYIGNAGRETPPYRFSQLVLSRNRSCSPLSTTFLYSFHPFPSIKNLQNRMF